MGWCSCESRGRLAPSPLSNRPRLPHTNFVSIVFSSILRHFLLLCPVVPSRHSQQLKPFLSTAIMSTSSGLGGLSGGPSGSPPRSADLDDGCSGGESHPPFVAGMNHSGASASSSPRGPDGLVHDSNNDSSSLNGDGQVFGNGPEDDANNGALEGYGHGPDNSSDDENIPPSIRAILFPTEDELIGASTARTAHSRPNAEPPMAYEHLSQMPLPPEYPRTPVSTRRVFGTSVIHEQVVPFWRRVDNMPTAQITGPSLLRHPGPQDEDDPNLGPMRFQPARLPPPTPTPRRTGPLQPYPAVRPSGTTNTSPQNQAPYQFPVPSPVVLEPCSSQGETTLDWAP